MSLANSFRPKVSTGWLAACASVALVAMFAAQAFADDLPLELQPYRIHTVVTFGPQPEWTPTRQRIIRDYLLARADDVVGAPWSVEFLEVDAVMADRVLTDLDHFELSDLPEEWLDLPCEKIIFVSLGGDDDGLQITAREFDQRTRLFGVTVRRSVAQLARAPDDAFGAMLDAFAPLAEITSVNEQDRKQVTVNFRAGALPTRDPQLVLFRPKDVLRPVVRFNDSMGKPRRIQPLEWTLLTVEKVDGAQAECRVHSGLRNPISGRRRIEQLALAVNAVPSTGTTLTLEARLESKKPLAGYGLDDFDSETMQFTRIGQTNQNGQYVFQPTPNLMRVVAVRSGNDILARLVFVPGLQPSLTASVPDDDQRLQVEGFIVALQEQVVDWVVRREILMTQIRAAIDDGKPDEARKLIAQLREMERSQGFTARLAAQRRMRAAADPTVQRKINKLFDDTQQVLDKYLVNREIDELERKVIASR